MNFSKALEHLNNGDSLYREGWNSQKQWIKKQVPDEHSKMSQPYIYIKTSYDKNVPWGPSNSDIFGEDWQVKEELNAQDE